MAILELDFAQTVVLIHWEDVFRGI